MITEVVRKHSPPPPEEDRMVDLFMSVRFTIHRTDYTPDERKEVDTRFNDLMELLKHPALDRNLARDMLVVTQPLLDIWMHNGVLIDCVRAIEDATEAGTLSIGLLAQAHMLLSRTRDEYGMPHADVERINARLERCSGRAAISFTRGRRIAVT